MRLAIPIALTFYAIGAVVMFGTMYHRTSCFSYEGNHCPDTKASGALIAAIVWPLSLSAILQEQK